MNKALKWISFVAALVVAAGIVLMGIGYALSGGTIWSIGITNGRVQVQPMGSFGEDWETNATRHSQDLEAFHNIEVDGDFFEIELIPSDEQKYFVFSAVSGNLSKPDIRVENDTLKITAEMERHSLRAIGKQRRLIQIYYPKDTRFDKINLDIAAAELKGHALTANELVLDMAAGSVDLDDVDFQTADVRMDAGEVAFDGGTVEEMKLKINAGNFEADDFSTNALTVDINMGNVEINGALNGKSRFDVNMGEIELNLEGRREEYKMDLTTNMGTIEVDDRNYRDYQNGEAVRGEITAEVAMGTLTIECD